ncbi:MAG: AmmeMemoRadiSam system protein B [Candidatus Kryptonium sp.]|nr:AmmeMemoRadiSam system protein B [Candidatus Kryptonium sp.]MCX7762142.1 AmmeMemoRadiSam system protein B [Candidatus Kryptonium sp.]MDW8109008.1 AmmeMemoRadiSam system protein B [Candidatus Kryptonium sp.]
MIKEKVRHPAVAGLFYPDVPSILNAEIEKMFERAKDIIGDKKISGEIKALIAPHAGYMYSGQTAAIAYSLIRGKDYDTVVVVSPSHREYFDAISIYDGKSYKTPLGEIEIDFELAEEIVSAGNGLIEFSSYGHRSEHAVEVHLPFLQKALNHFKLVPIVMGDQKSEYSFRLGDILGEVLTGRNVLLVASTDLSHYYPYDVAMKFDKIVIDDIASFNPEKLMDDLEQQRCEACGGGPTVAVMRAAKKLGADKSEVLYYCNSGDVTGDKTGVVGYLSAVLFKQVN